MGTTLSRIAVDVRNKKEIEQWRQRLRNIGITDKRLLSDNRVIRFVNEKAKRNKNLIDMNEIIRILQG